ncbi:MAG: lysylphosphatidylglycerol synthase transmembrane domain-containing protein [Coriobacteriia bacterium]|nr:lysylphosphatidylglycerol synthase transmembrane domain-containing protein [Coriobacteriia bacterium]
MRFGKMIRALVFAVLASALVYAVMVALSDGPAVLDAFARIPAALVVLLVGMSTAAYVARGLRWGWLMRRLGYPVSTRDALYLHFAGQTMSVSPARVGEVLKPWLAREVTGMPMSVGIALVFCERVADLIAVCILALGALSLVGGDIWVLVASLIAVMAGTALASSEWFHRVVLRVLSRQAWARHHQEALASMSETVRTSLAWRTLLLAVPVSVFAWGLEGVGLWLLVREAAPGALGPWATVSVYAVATLVGAFSFLPAGIGLTEASLAGVLVASGLHPSAAAASTLVIRVTTLWWSVACGWLALGTRPALSRRLFGRAAPEEE